MATFAKSGQSSKDALRIVSVPPMLVARFYGFGPNPEDLAFEQFRAWAEPRGYGDRATYGFNDPSPGQDSKDYGYEVWMPIDDEECEGAETRRFDGGRYAVSRYFWCGNPGEGIPMAWAALSERAHQLGYPLGRHQWLEKTFDDSTGKGLELMLPIGG